MSVPPSEKPLAKAKEEASTLAQTLFSAALRALYVLAIEGVIHVLLHGLERVTGEKFPSFVYAIVLYGGAVSFLVYVGTRLYLHCVEAYVEARMAAKELLAKLAAREQEGD